MVELLNKSLSQCRHYLPSKCVTYEYNANPVSTYCIGDEMTVNISCFYPYYSLFILQYTSPDFPIGMFIQSLFF